MRIAVCPGSFDPVTKGHLDIINRAAKLFDKVIVLVVINPDKNPYFSVEERVRFIKRVTADIPNVEVDAYGGLLAEYVSIKNACAIVKGLRAVSDFEYEFQMALANKHLNHELETLFLTTSPEYLYLSSSLVKQMAAFGGDVSEFIPQELVEDILARLRKKEATE